jgi:predicted glycosyltransferase
MMDYEFQPANHLSFRLADRILVPRVFPDAALRRFGARPKKVVRYEGFKEELYLSGYTATRDIPRELGLDETRVIAVFRPPPDGALYHRIENPRFDELLDEASSRSDVEVVVLPRTAAQAERYAPRARIPDHAVDGAALLALADLVIGGGGTMTREAALLGTPTYTVFAGSLAAVDQALIDRGVLFDLRDPDTVPRFAKKTSGHVVATHGPELLATVLEVLDETAG